MAMILLRNEFVVLMNLQVNGRMLDIANLPSAGFFTPWRLGHMLSVPVAKYLTKAQPVSVSRSFPTRLLFTLLESMYIRFKSSPFFHFPQPRSRAISSCVCAAFLSFKTVFLSPRFSTGPPLFTASSVKRCSWH